MKPIISFVLTSLLLLLGSPNAVVASDDFLNQLRGDWSGEGTAFGANATVKQKWEWVLAQKFFRLTLRYEVKTANGGTQLFEGHGYYKPKGNSLYEGQWFDVQGNQYPLRSGVEAGAMTAEWGIPGKVEGRSVYRLIDAGKRLESIDSLKQKDGSWKEFSRFKLEK